MRMWINEKKNFTGNSHHINIRYFFRNDRVEKGDIIIMYFRMHMMVADIFTKPLQGALFRKFRK